MCSTNPVSAKTAASVLQELMTKKGRMPEYECIGQSGLDHEKVFEYLCTADGVTVKATARSKKDAKQAAARQALAALAARGETIPAPFNIPLEANEEMNGEEAAVVEAAAGAVVAAAAESTSYVALLKEFCESHCEAAPEYSLVEETGPPHLRRFTMSAVVGNHKFMATASSKRAARQDAAAQLYRCLRENQPTGSNVRKKMSAVVGNHKFMATASSKRAARQDAAAQLYRCLRENQPTGSNVRKKDDELVTANERAMRRYSEYIYWGKSWGLPIVRSRGPPSLRNQTLAQYYDTGLRNSEQRVAALAALDAGGEDAVMLALRALNLQVHFERLGKLNILTVPRAVPPLTFAALAPCTPERSLADYLQNALTLKVD